MKNYISNGKEIEITLGADIVSGAPLLIGDILGVAVKDGANGDTGFPMAIEGVFTLPKTTSDTFDPGQILFWDDSGKKLTETASTNKPVAISMETAGSSATTVVAKLHAFTRDTTA